MAVAHVELPFERQLYLQAELRVMAAIRPPESPVDLQLPMPLHPPAHPATASPPLYPPRCSMAVYPLAPNRHAAPVRLNTRSAFGRASAERKRVAVSA